MRVAVSRGIWARILMIWAISGIPAVGREAFGSNRAADAAPRRWAGPDGAGPGIVAG